MSSLDIRLFPRFYDPLVEIDGQLVKGKKDQGALLIHYETDKPAVLLHVYTLPSELSGPHWFGYAALFFFLSLFSVFDISYKKKDDYSFEYKGSIDLTKNPSLSLALGDAKEGCPAILYKQGSSYSETANLVSFDGKCKGRRRWLIALRIVMTALFVVLLGYCLYKVVASIS